MARALGLTEYRDFPGRPPDLGRPPCVIKTDANRVGGTRVALSIIGDAGSLRFGAGLPGLALEWARQAVLAHVAAPKPSFLDFLCRAGA